MRNFEIKNQNGRSMIEMLGVLAIIGVLSVGGIAGYSKAMQKYRINKAIEQITLIAGNVRAFFAPQRSYEGLHFCSEDNGYGDKEKAACKLIKKAKLMPDEMWDDTAKMFKNVFGYYIGLYTAHKSSNTDKQAFSIGYGIPADYELCIELLSHDWTSAGMKGIRIGHGPFTNKTVPVSIDDAVNECKDNTDVINFYFDVNSNCWSETNGNTCS